MKHAYLILAHNNFYNLRKLIEALDDENNDIYIHIDKAAKFFNQAEWHKSTQKSQILFVERMRVGYCDYTQLSAVLLLMNVSTQKYHDYYHVLSGADLPIKSNKKIDDFFHANYGKEFVGFAKDYHLESICQRNYFVKYLRSKNRYIVSASIKARHLLIKLQKIFGYNIALKYSGVIKKGCDWYSITHAAAKYLIAQEPNFRKLFSKSFCPTEFFAQTLLYNSDFKANIYCLEDENIGSQRYIDWQRGNPHVFTMADKELLEKSSLLFARKFSDTSDRKIIDDVSNFISP